MREEGSKWKSFVLGLEMAHITSTHVLVSILQLHDCN